MKTIKRVLFIILIFSGSVYTAECQKSGSKDKIKSIVVTEEKNDMLIKKQYKESETFYDTRGNIIEEITYKQNKVNKHFKYNYDTDNNKIKEQEFDASGRIIESSEYKFENGLRVEKIVYDDKNKVKSRKIYTYTTY